MNDDYKKTPQLKEVWFDYLVSNKKLWCNGFTKGRLEKVKDFVLSDNSILDDLFIRHGAAGHFPEEVKEQNSRDASIFFHIKNGGYFDGRDSWKNKYKNGDYKQGPAYFGSTSFLAWTTDGPHLTSTITHQADAWAMVMMPADNNRRFSHLLLKVAALTVARSAGHVLMYDVLIKNQNR